MLRAGLATTDPPGFVNRVTDVMSTGDDSGRTTCELSSDWDADVIIRAESGSWSDSGATTDVTLYVMTSAYCAAGETICEFR